MDIQAVLLSKRKLKATTGVSVQEFRLLSDRFEIEYEFLKDKKYTENRPRKRKKGGGRKPTLKSSDERFIFYSFLSKKLCDF